MLEGYFPYELKDEYPEGVMFQVTDRSTETHTPSTPNPQCVLIFPTSANHFSLLCNDCVGVVLCCSLNLGFAVKRPNGAAALLNALPQSVVSGGKVIQIRSELSQLLHKKDVYQNNGDNVRAKGKAGQCSALSVGSN
jgi:hypothetical protein